MRFSVIIPAYNRENCIARAINSILNQTYKDFECIVVDDGSADKTGEICKKIQNENTKLTYYYKQNGGVSSARNYGLKRADGEYILFLDSDDELRNNALETIQNVLTSNKVDMICFGMGSWKPNERICDKILDKNEILKIMPAQMDIESKGIYYVRESSCNKCYNKKLLGDNKICFDEGRRLWEDGVFVTDALAASQSIYVIQDSLYINGDSGKNDHLSSGTGTDAIYSMLDNWDYYMSHYGTIFNFETNYAKWFYFSCICQIIKQSCENYDSEAFETVLNKLLKTESFNKLCDKFLPCGYHEKRYKKTIKTKNTKLISEEFSKNTNKFGDLYDKILRRIHFKMRGIRY